MSIHGDTGDKRQTDFDDLQRELAGQDVGRMSRFLNGNDPRSVEAKKKKASDQAIRTVLDQMLQDAEYRALYETLGNRLGNAEREADTMLERIEAQIAANDFLISEMESEAARGPNGSPVFRYADGRVVDANGEAIPIEIADGIMWPENAPSAEDYFAAKQVQSDLNDQRNDWSAYRNDVLGDVRNRHDDEDNPMSKDGMRDALDGIETSRPAPFAQSWSQGGIEAKTAPMPQAFPEFN